MTRPADDELDRRWRGEAEEREYRRVKERPAVTKARKAREREDRREERRRDAV
jgi:hypothetical protein